MPESVIFVTHGRTTCTVIAKKHLGRFQKIAVGTV